MELVQLQVSQLHKLLLTCLLGWKLAYTAFSNSNCQFVLTAVRGSVSVNSSGTYLVYSLMIGGLPTAIPYENNMDCSFLLSPGGNYQTINISFTSMDTEPATGTTLPLSPIIRADVLSFYNSNTTTNLVNQFSGNLIPANFGTLVTPATLVTFVTNSQNTYGGFNFNYVASTAAPACDFTFTNASGYFGIGKNA